MRPHLFLLPILSGLLVLGACAGDGDPNRYEDVGHGDFRHGGGGDPGPRRQAGLPNLFMSPAGKPYRAGRGEPYPVAVWFAAADTDHDGKLTVEEFRRDAEAFFHELDTSHDGVIDGFEIQAYEQRIAPEILPRVEGLAAGEGMDLSLGRESQGRPTIGSNGAARRAGDRRPSAGDLTPQGAGLYSLLNEPEPVTAADTQFDSKITLKEFLAAADRRFAALDTKGQGYLTLAGLPKTPVQEAMEREAERRAKEKAKGGPAKPQ
jgi:EF hand